MLSTSRIWLDGVRAFATEHRLRKPLPDPASAAERAAERMILAAQLDYRHKPCNFVEIMPRLDEHLRRGAGEATAS